MRYLLISLIAIVLFSCTENRIYENTHTFEDKEWSYSDSIEFTFEVEDTSQLYGLGMTVTFSEDYPYQNIYTNIKTFLPNGETRKNLFSVELQKSEKRRSLQCNDETCLADVFLQAPLKFIDEGEYTIRVFQHSRDQSLEGISNVGLYVEELKSAYKE